MALSKSRSSSESDRTRFLRFAFVVVDELTPILRDVLEQEISHSDLYQKVLGCKKLFDRLQKQSDQLCIIQNACNDGYKDFDITLLYSLISNLCSQNISPTKQWWTPNMPSQGEIKLGDDIERIRLIKNKLYSHKSKASISETEFNEYWAILHSVCGRIGNHLNKDYIKRLKKAETCVIDQKRESELLEKIEEMCRRDNEMREQIAEIADSLRRIEEGLPSVVLKVTIEEKDPPEKGISEVLLKITEKILNDMVDCINEVTSEEELTKVYESVERSLQNETYETVRAFIGPFFDKLSSKISNYANTRVQKIGILNNYLKFVNEFKKRYDADIKACHSSLLLKLTFSSEEGYERYEEDLERGEIGRKILDLLLFPEYIACFDLKDSNMIISLNDKTINGSENKKNYEKSLPGMPEGSIPTTSAGYFGSAFPFSKRAPHQDTLTTNVKAEVTRSVGLIYVDGNQKGTGFRVGEKYIMTCLHVIKDIIEGSPDFIRCEMIYIQFEMMLHLQDTDQSITFHFEPTLVYKHEEFDVAVLELRKHDVKFPTPLSSFATNFLYEEVNLISYPSKVKLREESEIYPAIIEPNNDVDNYISKLSQWSMKTFKGTDYYLPLREHPKKIIFQTATAIDLKSCPSGSPGILIRNQKPCVVLFFSGVIEGIELKPEKRLGFGYAVKDIFDEMQKNENDRKLSAEIFQEWIS